MGFSLPTEKVMETMVGRGPVTKEGWGGSGLLMTNP